MQPKFEAYEFMYYSYAITIFFSLMCELPSKRLDKEMSDNSREHLPLNVNSVKILIIFSKCTTNGDPYIVNNT